MRYCLFGYLAAFILSGLCGCALIRHNSQLLALKDLADSQSLMDAALRRQEINFTALKQAILENRFKAGMNKQYIESRYGEPIYCRDDKTGPATCVYRPPAAGFFSEIVYLRYTQAQTLASWEYLPAEKSSPRL